VKAWAELHERTALDKYCITFKLGQAGIDEPALRLLAARGAQDFRMPVSGGSLVLESQCIGTRCPRLAYPAKRPPRVSTRRTSGLRRLNTGLSSRFFTIPWTKFFCFG